MIDFDTYTIQQGWTDDGQPLVSITFTAEGLEGYLTFTPEDAREMADLLNLSANEIECAGAA